MAPPFLPRDLGNSKVLLLIELAQDPLNILVITELDLLIIFTVEGSGKLIPAVLKFGVNRPVLFGFEITDFIFPLDNQVKGLD